MSEFKQQKQSKGKNKFFGRVDIPSVIEPIAELRKRIIEDIGKYPESMEWPDITSEEFIDAIQRHLNEIYMENNPFAFDKETGLPHIYAIGFNYMVLSMKFRELATSPVLGSGSICNTIGPDTIFGQTRKI